MISFEQLVDGFVNAMDARSLAAKHDVDRSAVFDAVKALSPIQERCIGCICKEAGKWN